MEALGLVLVAELVLRRVGGVAEALGLGAEAVGDATQLLLTTQYLDMLEALGRDDAGGTTKLFLPTAMTAVDDMRSRLTMFSKAFK